MFQIFLCLQSSEDSSLKQSIMRKSTSMPLEPYASDIDLSTEPTVPATTASKRQGVGRVFSKTTPYSMMPPPPPSKGKKDKIRPHNGGASAAACDTSGSFDEMCLHDDDAVSILTDSIGVSMAKPNSYQDPSKKYTKHRCSYYPFLGVLFYTDNGWELGKGLLIDIIGV